MRPNRLKQRILEALGKRGAMTASDLWAHEVGIASAMISGVTSRLSELTKAGLVEKAGKGRSLQTGRVATLWRLKQAA